MPFHLARAKTVPALLASLSRLWKSERTRHLACVFEGEQPSLALEACQAHGLPTFYLADTPAVEVIATLGVKALNAGHEPVLVSNDPRLEALCQHRDLQLLRVSGKGKNLRLDYLDHEQVLSKAGALRTDLAVPFSLEALTPGPCSNLSDLYRRLGMQKELDQLQGLFGEPQSVLQLWS